MSRRTLYPLLLAVAVAKLALDHIADPDLFWHVQLGLDILARRGLPTTVEHAWSAAGAPYTPNDWASEVVLALLYRTGGWPGVALAKAAIAALMIVTTYATAYRRSGNDPRAAGAATSVMTFVAATQLITRPLLFGNLCLAAELFFLEKVRQGSRRAALVLPLIFAAWINLHGSWPVGLGPLAVALGGAWFRWSRGRLHIGMDGPPPARSRDKIWLSGAAVLSLLALLVNPVGPALLLRPFKVLAHRAELAAFDEWSAAPWITLPAWVLVGSAVLLAAAALRGRRPIPLLDFGLSAAVFAMACSAARSQAIYAVIAAPVLADQLAGWMTAEQEKLRPRANAAIAAAAAMAFGCVGAYRVLHWEEDFARNQPVQAVNALLQSGVAREPGFHYYDWGGYLVFKGVSSFIDGRLEPFLDNGVFGRYFDLERGGDVGAIEAQGVRWILVPPGDRVADAVRSRSGWHVAYEDAQAGLWLRD